MARSIRVEILADDAQYTRAMARAGSAARGFGHEIDRASRGALSASLSFHGLGRAAAFASAEFLGGAGIVYAIKSTVQAAEESQRVLGQTQNAVARAGLTWRTYGQTIRQALLAQSQVAGFDDERLSGTFATLIRRTRDVNEALKLNALAANVARGRNIELEQATQLVLKASLGQSGALRRLGIDAQKGAKATELLALLQRNYAKSAETYGKTAAGAQDRFRVAIQNTQEAIATGYLPALANLLNRGANWLNQAKNQKRITDDVRVSVMALSETVRTAAKVFGTFASAIGEVKSAFDKLPKFSGLDILKGIGNQFQIANPLHLLGIGGGGGSSPQTPAGLGGPRGSASGIPPGIGGHPVGPAVNFANLNAANLPLKSGTASTDALIARLGLPGGLGGSYSALGRLPMHLGGQFASSFGDFNVPMGLQVAEARAGTTAGGGDDARVAMRIRTYAQMAIRAGQLSWQGLIDAYNTIAQQNQVLGSHAITRHGKILSTRNLTAGIAFADADARRAQEARLAQYLAHNTVVQMNIDGKKVGEAVVPGLQRRAKRQSPSTRNGVAGTNLGMW